MRTLLDLAAGVVDRFAVLAQLGHVGAEHLAGDRLHVQAVPDTEAVVHNVEVTGSVRDLDQAGR